MRVEIESVHHSNDIHEEHDMRISADVIGDGPDCSIENVSWRCVSGHRCNASDMCATMGLETEDRERLQDEALYQSSRAYERARNELSRIQDVILSSSDGTRLEEIAEKLKGVAA